MTSTPGTGAPPQSPTRTNSSTASGKTLDQGDPTVRTALRYTLSPREYELLHQYLISRAPTTVRKRAPQPAKYPPAPVAKEGKTSDNGEGGEIMAEEEADFNAATVRIAVRLFGATYAGFKGWELLVNRLRKGKAQPPASTGNGNLRTAASFALILFWHRLLHRFWTRLRASLLLPSAEPFRRRNPRVAAALISRFTPAIGASLAGVWLALCPGPTPSPTKGSGGGSRASRFRVTIAVYALFKAAEWGWEASVKKGWITRARKRSEIDDEDEDELEAARQEQKGSRLQLPSWFGSWMLMPAIYAQLLHAFVFDRDCFPEAYGSFILGHSPEYVHPRPAGLPAELEWPTTTESVDALAEMARMGWPAFISPIIHPKAKALATPTLRKTTNLISTAHPLHPSLSCALLHPTDPSCARVALQNLIRSFPRMLRYNLLLYFLFSLPRLLSSSTSSSNTSTNKLTLVSSLLLRATRTTLTLTMSITSAWSTLCLLAAVLPGRVLRTRRFLLAGASAGLWAAMDDPATGRATFLYSARAAADSLWRVGVKKGWWRAVKGGDVLVFMLGLAGMGIVVEREEGVLGRGEKAVMSILRGRKGPVGKDEDGAEKQVKAE